MDHNNFNLKEDILLPVKLHFPDFFVRGSLHHKSLIPTFVFLKPIEYSALRGAFKRCYIKTKTLLTLFVSACGFSPKLDDVGPDGFPGTGGGS